MPSSVLVVAIVLGPSVLYVPVIWLFRWWRRRLGLPPAVGSYPGSREHVGELNLGWWESLSNSRRAAMDAAALEAAAAAERVRDDAQEAARVAVERSGDISPLFRP